MKIKESFLSIMALLWLSCPTYGYVSNQPQTVIMGGQFNNPNVEGGSFKRAPIAPVYVNKEGHNFSFNSSLAGETIEVFDGDTLLYTDVIGSDGAMSIPENITGAVELCLVREHLTYRAVVEL